VTWWPSSRRMLPRRLTIFFSSSTIRISMGTP
jgi:hypothetical protein